MNITNKSNKFKSIDSILNFFLDKKKIKKTRIFSRDKRSIKNIFSETICILAKFQ